MGGRAGAGGSQGEAGAGQAEAGGSQAGAGGSQAQAWFRAKARLMPGTLTASPPWVRSVFEHAWAPMTALAQQIGCLPDPLWAFLIEYPGGFATVSSEASRYVPGTSRIGGEQVENVAIVSVQDLAKDNEKPLHVIGQLVDHYLGCGGDSGGPWLSAGGGVVPLWRETGRRLDSLFSLGYGVDDVAQSGPSAYFAQSLAWYCRDWRRLNVADPQICKWFRSTLWNEVFWSLPVRQERV